MKTFYLSTAFTVFCCVAALSQDSIFRKKIYTLSEERKSAYDFYKKLQLVSDLSTLSGVVTGYDYIIPRAWQKKPYILHANVQTPIPIGGSWFRARKVYFSIHIIPEFEVRILKNDSSKNDVSSPVRTPSYRPGATLFVSGGKLWDNRTKSQNYFAFKLFHHSNGQDGPEIDTKGIYNVGDDTVGYFNRYNGNFASNLAFEFIYGGIIKLAKTGKNKNKITSNYSEYIHSSHSLYWRTSYLLEPEKFTSAMKLTHAYGNHRFKFQLGWILHPLFKEILRLKKLKIKEDGNAFNKELIRVYFDFELVGDLDFKEGSIYSLRNAEWYRRINTSITFSWRIPGTSFSGVFLQAGFHGNDRYNVYFQQSRIFVRAGICTGLMMYKTTDQE